MLSWLRRRDVAMTYAVIVLGLAIAVAMLPGRLSQRFVIDSSTNLANLRSHPPYVLIVSAFVQAPLWQIWMLAPVVWVYGEVQRWLGRFAVVVVATLGHIGATLFVATMLAAGIAHGRVSLAEARAADVGVSYGLVAALGLLAARVPPRWRSRYVAAVTAVVVLALAIDRSFTDLGHVCAWGIGLSLAWLLLRAEPTVQAETPAGEGLRGR